MKVDKAVERREAHREALRAGIEKELIPLAKTLGFRRGALKHLAPHDGKCMVRERGDIDDQIKFYFFRHTPPMFSIEFWTAPRDNIKNYYEGRIYARPRRWHQKILGSEPLWFGGNMTAEEGIMLAKVRLLELEHYLKTGEIPENLSLWHVPDEETERLSAGPQS